MVAAGDRDPMTTILFCLLAAAALATKVAGYPLLQPLEATFFDVSSQSPYYREVETAWAAGLFEPLSEKMFLPNDAIVREEAANLMVRVAEFPLVKTQSPSFCDVPADSPYFAFVETALHNGIIGGPRETKRQTSGHDEMCQEHGSLHEASDA